MKAKPTVFFRPIEGSAPLSIHWYPGPFGDAKEAASGNGVFWCSPNGEILAVQFDDVHEDRDDQSLVCNKNLRIELTVRKGKAKFKVVHGKDQAA